ncbi:MAG: ABC transporter permease [Verrucomicrobiae bacterium]|nr:ABC transporter permease [Verrucomicrobiae bacterium]
MELIGSNTLSGLRGVGNLAFLFVETVQITFTRRPRWRQTIRQLNFIGVRSIPVVVITGAFTGMVFAVQSYWQFHKVKMDTAVGALVAVSIARELGPVLTALMVAGRVGAASAAELGTMRVTEQIDALRALATNPTDFLVVPRFVAMMLAMPLLTAFAILTGIFSGYWVAIHLLGVESSFYITNMNHYMAAKDIYQGLIKACFFGFFIIMISCYKGMTCREGAEGVGRATTQAVVVSSITVLISNFFITMLLNAMSPS